MADFGEAHIDLEILLFWVDYYKNVSFVDCVVGMYILFICLFSDSIFCWEMLKSPNITEDAATSLTKLGKILAIILLNTHLFPVSLFPYGTQWHKSRIFSYNPINPFNSVHIFFFSVFHVCFQICIFCIICLQVHWLYSLSLPLYLLGFCSPFFLVWGFTVL